MCDSNGIMCMDAALRVLRGMGVVGTESAMPKIRPGSLVIGDDGVWAHDEANDESVFTLVSPQVFALGVDLESVTQMVEKSRRAVFN